MDNLKNCPFCGQEAFLGFIGNNKKTIWYGQCIDCRASTRESEDRLKAMEYWNRRYKEKPEKKRKIL